MNKQPSRDDRHGFFAMVQTKTEILREPMLLSARAGYGALEVRRANDISGASNRRLTEWTGPTRGGQS